MKMSRARVNPEDEDSVYRAQTSRTYPIYPDDYRKCSQICRAEMGERCFSTSGRVVNGQPDKIRTYLDHPHIARKLRTRKKKA